MALLLPESRGELTLTSSDYRVQPAMRYNYLAEPFDRERLRAGIRLTLELAERHELSPMLGRRNRTGGRRPGQRPTPWINGCCGKRQPTPTSRAPAGWGPSGDPLAVVDQYGNIHGIERVAHR